MFVGTILSGIWSEQTITLKGMPEDFVLSARELVVLETDEYETLREQLPEQAKKEKVNNGH